MTRKHEKAICELPATCTAVVNQKNNNNRVSVFAEGRFLAGFDKSVAEKFGIRSGTRITEELIDKMQAVQENSALREYFFGCLARRSHSRHELLQKAVKKGFDPVAAEPVLSRLETDGYLDDRRFAEQFASDKSGIYGWGPKKIRAGLYQKGIEKRYIDAALDAVLTHEQISANLKREVGKRKPYFLRVKDLRLRKKKMMDFLIRKGYVYDIILAESEALMQIIEDEKP